MMTEATKGTGAESAVRPNNSYLVFTCDTAVELHNPSLGCLGASLKNMIHTAISYHTVIFALPPRLAANC
jgi:hypothetical protein